MQFDTAILTEEGVRLLTTASLDDRLVLTKFLFAASPFEPSPDLTTLPNTWGDGHVETQRTEGGVIHVDASASNRLTSGRAYGFGIWGYLSSEGAETGERLLLSAKAISPVVEVTLASGAWTIFRIHVAIKFAPASADAIIVEPSYNGFVSIDAFNRLETAVDALEERVVTTHAKGSTTTGDDQLVLGDKTFRSFTFKVEAASLVPKPVQKTEFVVDTYGCQMSDDTLAAKDTANKTLASVRVVTCKVGPTYVPAVLLNAGLENKPRSIEISKDAINLRRAFQTSFSGTLSDNYLLYDAPDGSTAPNNKLTGSTQLDELHSTTSYASSRLLGGWRVYHPLMTFFMGGDTQGRVQVWMNGATTNIKIGKEDPGGLYGMTQADLTQLEAGADPGLIGYGYRFAPKGNSGGTYYFDLYILAADSINEVQDWANLAVTRTDGVYVTPNTTGKPTQSKTLYDLVTKCKSDDTNTRILDYVLWTHPISDVQGRILVIRDTFDYTSSNQTRNTERYELL